MSQLQKYLFSIFAILFASSGFSDSLVVENLTSYPDKNQNSKIAIQWATSAVELEEGNQALISGSKLDPNTIQVLRQSGKIKVTIPKRAAYFRIIAWSKGDGEPDFHTNWVEIIPNKTYILETDHLVPSVLMQGMGC